MTEHPILFSGPMVRAILDGRKTVTRRPVTPQPDTYGMHQHPGVLRGNLWTWWTRPDGETPRAADPANIRRCHYGEPGDRLWVREVWRKVIVDEDRGPIAYRATDEGAGGPWRPSIHMPRWASRLTLEVVSVRAERVQDITGADVVAEGIPCSLGLWADFADLWNDTYAARGYGWASNPWVWRVEFRRLETP